VLYQVCYTTKALADVNSILAWFDAQGAKEAGDRWLIELYAKIDSLEKQPQRYSIVSEYSQTGDEIREFLYGSRANKHRVIFRIHSDRVFVLRIWHRARGQLKFEDLT
jgi:plasmid stabilization system protein ParE